MKALEFLHKKSIPSHLLNAIGASLANKGVELLFAPVENLHDIDKEYVSKWYGVGKASMKILDSLLAEIQPMDHKKHLNVKEVESNLCWFNERSPKFKITTSENLIGDDHECECENCLAGRSKLADQLLLFMDRYLRKKGV